MRCIGCGHPISAHQTLSGECAGYSMAVGAPCSCQAFVARPAQEFPPPDREAGRREQLAAEARVEAHTPPVWRDIARTAFADAARKHPTFTTDEVWELLRARYPDAWQPPEPRAMSGIVRWATTSGLVEFTGQWVATARPEAHSNPKRQYRSLGARSAG